MSLADAWEDNARDWMAWARAPGHDGFWDGTWPALVEIMPEPGGLVLDLGCGEGRAARLLRAGGWQVIGVERSPTLARAAATGSPPVPVTLADAAALPFADGTIGLVVACMSLMDVDGFDGAHDSPVPGRELRLSRPYLQARRYEDHFERDGLAMTFVSMHRPLGAYTAAIFGRGLVITDLREHGDGDIPWLLAIRAEKRPLSSGPDRAGARPDHDPAPSPGTGGQAAGEPGRPCALPVGMPSREPAISAARQASSGQPAERWVPGARGRSLPIVAPRLRHPSINQRRIAEYERVGGRLFGWAAAYRCTKYGRLI